ncbi:MAG: TolC family protein, partial [Bacteroidales bacterium]|nr:TolC family protein [Bacteroidales bacterium]
LMHRVMSHLEARQQQGMAMRNDLTRHELQLQDLQLGRRKVEDARAIVNHQLCLALGIDDEKIMPDMKVAETAFGQEGEQHWHDLAVTESPELARTQIASQMAGEQLRLAKSDYLPKVAVVVADKLWGPFTEDLPPVDKNLNIWYVGLGVRYQLGSLWKSNKKVHRAHAELQKSHQTRAVVTEAMDARMQEAYTLYMQSYAELETQQKSVQLATQNYNVVTNRYENQLALITDMIDASNMKLGAELREVDARVNIAFAYYKLLFVAGKL